MSSSKPLLKSKQIFTDATMSGTNTITSTEIDVSAFNAATIDLTWTGTPNGSFVVQFSVPLNADGTGSNFQSITLSSSPTASGAAGSHLIDLQRFKTTKLRVRYTNSSSSGVLNGWITVGGN